VTETGTESPHDRHRILERYILLLNAQRETLDALFQAAQCSITEKDRPDLQGYSPDWKPLKALREAWKLDQAQEIYAACLFLVLNSWVQQLAAALDIPPGRRNEAGPAIHNTRLAALIRVTANNFRHPKSNDETVSILNAGGIFGSIENVVASQVLEIIGPQSFAELEAGVHVIGQDFVRMTA
jgi:hypothetical protein